jgi:propanediol dehydratase large subunit
MDRQRVNLDGFAIEDPDLGLTALRSQHDPEPSLVVSGDPGSAVSPSAKANSASG